MQCNIQVFCIYISNSCDMDDRYARGLLCECRPTAASVIELVSVVEILAEAGCDDAE